MELIIDAVRHSCERFSEKAAFRVKTGGRWVDYRYRQLWVDSDRVARGLADWGLAAGERAAILAPASPSWVAAYLGILKAGGIVVPIDKELKRGELRHILADCSARVLFTVDAGLETLHDALGELPELKKIVLLHGQESEIRQKWHLERLFDEFDADWQRTARDYRISDDDRRRLETHLAALREHLQPRPKKSGEAASSALLGSRPNSAAAAVSSLAGFMRPGEPPRLAMHPDDPAVILYTSGTTGRSKGAMLSHTNIVSNIRTVIPLFGLNERMTTLSFLPINHVFEQVGGILLPLSLGGTVSFAESIKKLGDNLAEVKPNFMLGVPAVFRLLLDRLNRNIRDDRLARFLFAIPLTRPLIARKVRQAMGGTPVFVSGGAALDPAVAMGLEALGITVYQGYGITETSPVISAERPDRRRPGTVGPPLPGVEVRIVNANEEGVGEIWAKGPNIMLGYFNNPAATAEVLVDGWYHTGDLGHVDSDGVLTIHGRLKNVIVTANGKNVYPEEVENELLHSPYIAEVMVYGHKIDRHSEEVCAQVYPNQEAVDQYGSEKGLAPMTQQQVEELIRAEIRRLGSGLADYKRVRRFTLREDEFPKTTTRKIKRFAVDARLDAGV